MTQADIIVSNPCGSVGEMVCTLLNDAGYRAVSVTGPSPKRNAPGYLRALKEAVSTTGAQIILPVFFPEILAHYRAEFPGVTILCESEEKLRLLDSKVSACDLAAIAGIPQPARYASPEEIADYPVVFKRAWGQGGDSVYFPNTRRSLENLLKTSSGHILTEFVRGTEFSVDALRWDGFFYAASYKVLESKGKGVSVLRESVSYPQLERYAAILMDYVDYQGVCGFDFIVREDDSKAFFLECNPRFSGGLESAVKSGFNIPVLLIDLFKGRSHSPDDIHFTPGVRTGSALDNSAPPLLP